MALRNLRGSVGGRNLVDRLSAHVHGAGHLAWPLHGLHHFTGRYLVDPLPPTISHKHRRVPLHARELHLEALHLRGVLL